MKPKAKPASVKSITFKVKTAATAKHVRLAFTKWIENPLDLWIATFDGSHSKLVGKPVVTDVGAR